MCVGWVGEGRPGAFVSWLGISNIIIFKKVMKIRLDLKQIKTTITEIHKCSLKVHINDFHKIESAQSMLRKGTCNFMEVNSVLLNGNKPNYISFDFLIDRVLVARISLFCTEAMERKEIALSPVHAQDKNLYRLFYSLEIEDTESNGEAAIGEILNPKLKRRKTLNQQSQQISNLDEKSKIKYLQLSKMTYSFSKRLDPMVKLSHSAQTIINWKIPQYTIGIGIALSLLVLFPKISIILLCLMLIFGRNSIISKIQNMLPRESVESRLLPPEENLQLLYDGMELYCTTYETIVSFLIQNDRTKVITVIEIACKCGILVTLIMMYFSVEGILVMGIWFVLFLTSSTGKRFLSFISPKIVQYNRKLDKMLKNVSKSTIAKSLIEPISSSKHIAQVYKQFYIYEYERWWVAIKWKKEYYSNEEKGEELQARMEAPKGYEWVGQWKYEVGSNTDSDGYQYTNDLIRGSYTPNYKEKEVDQDMRQNRIAQQCDFDSFQGEVGQIVMRLDK